MAPIDYTHLSCATIGSIDRMRSTVNAIILVLRQCFKDLSNLAIKFQPRIIIILILSTCAMYKIKFLTKKLSYFLGFQPRQQLLKFFWFSSRTKKEKHMQDKPVNFYCLDSDEVFPRQKLSVLNLV